VCVWGASLPMAHFTFGFPNKNNQIWCLFAPHGGHFKIIEFTKSWECVKVNKGCVTFVALPFTLKKRCPKANKELWKIQIFLLSSQKNPLKETKILQHIITLL
jgi:hypothetical protein